jgi:hypothetical protein
MTPYLVDGLINPMKNKGVGAASAMATNKKKF